jgi:uncharacterized protein
MGENDVVEQAFLLQQRLAEINHPDHTLITYPNLGHNFYATNTLQTGIPDTKTEPIPEYVLADLYSWLEDHSRFTSPYRTAFVANNGTSSSNVTSSSSGK